MQKSFAFQAIFLSIVLKYAVETKTQRKKFRMKAYVTAPNEQGHILETEVAEPIQDSNQTLIRVSHFSLNRGELGFAGNGDGGRQIGWDIAGVVEKPAPDGSGPEAGTRVVAFSRAQRGWAELVTIPAFDLAVIPSGVEPAQAVVLPVAALTALYALERGERLLGSKVLITGATGGVGNFAVTLAALMGAVVIAQVRREDQVDEVLALGAHQVVVDSDGTEVTKYGPYRLVVDGLGNQLTSRAVHSLTPGGRAVLYGVTAGQELFLNAGFMLGTGRGRVEGFNLYRESEVESISKGLDRLLGLISSGTLKVKIEREGSWSDAPGIAQALLDREFGGKAAIRV